MLDRLKLLRQVSQFSGHLHHQLAQDLTVARQVWAQIAHDPNFRATLPTTRAPWPLPTWAPAELLAQQQPLPAPLPTYTVVATDGSQVYPDRQMGTNCFLLNIGTVQLHYGARSAVKVAAEPTIYNGVSGLEGANLNELVDCKRQELELQAGLALATAASPMPCLFLIDGALLFWQLDHAVSSAKKTFWERYLAILHELFVQKIWYAGYISLPNSKELVNLLRWQLYQAHADATPRSQLLRFINDVHVAEFYLAPGTYSVLFQHHGPLSARYPENLRPYFLYFNTGHELARVELPAWLAQMPAAVAQIMAIIGDQVQKGQGYPLCLAEAHAQAVVPNADREFFYQLLDQAGAKFGQRLTISRKLLRKRFMGV